MGGQSVSVVGLRTASLPSSALHRLCPFALAATAVWLIVLRKIQRCRGAGARLWLVAALCVGHNASHNTQILACFPHQLD